MGHKIRCYSKQLKTGFNVMWFCNYLQIVCPRVLQLSVFQGKTSDVIITWELVKDENLCFPWQTYQIRHPGVGGQEDVLSNLPGDSDACWNVWTTELCYPNTLMCFVLNTKNKITIFYFKMASKLHDK